MIETLVLAALGGVGAQALQLADYARRPVAERPDLRDLWFWVPWVVGIFLACLLAYAYIRSSIALSALLALNVGASAPLAFKAIAEAVPRRPEGVN